MYNLKHDVCTKHIHHHIQWKNLTELPNDSTVHENAVDGKTPISS